MPAFIIGIAIVTLIAVAGAQSAAYWFTARPPVMAGPFLILALALIAACAVVALIGYVLWLALWKRDPNPTPRVVGAVRRYLAWRFLVRRMGPLVLTFLFLGAFGTFKAMIAFIHPFAWDTLLSDLDRAVLGTDAWRITHAVIGPTGTRAIDIAYGLWFPAWTIAITHFSLFAREDLQRRFFLSFFAVWGILGFVLATFMSSAGPCFLDLIGHPYAGRYAGLPLEHAPGAVGAQDFLSAAHRAGSMGVAVGISAMPSVHVAVVALLVLAFRHYSRVLFAITIIFYAMILIGSVHLGWHYLSDGIVGSLAAAGIWAATRRPGTSISAGRRLIGAAST